MYKKIFHQLQHAFLMVMTHMKRTLLLIASIFLITSILVFMKFSINLTKEVSLVEAKDFPNDALLIKTNLPVSQIEAFDNINFKATIQMQPILVILNSPSNQNVKFELSGVNSNFLDYPIINPNKDTSLDTTELLAGRGIDELDIILERQSIVISEFVAKLLFDDYNPLNQVISFKIDNLLINFTVVGVVRDNASMKRYLSTLDLNENREQIIKNVFIPYTVSEKLGVTRVQNVIIRTKTNPDTLFEELLKDKLSSNTEWHTLRSNTFEIEKINQYTNQIFLYIQIILLIILTLLLVTSLFFMMNNRVREIGLKKAIGASDSNIALQFQYEMLFIGVIGGVLGTLIGYLITRYTYKSFDTILYTKLEIVDMNFVVLNLMYTILFSMLSALIATIIFLKNDPIDSLKSI